MPYQKLKYRSYYSSKILYAKDGFSLVECVIALVILMVAALTIVSVFNYSFKNNSNARIRFGALLLAQQRMEDARNTDFNNLTVGTVTESNVFNDGFPYIVVRTITNYDLVTSGTAPGPETRQITVRVTPFDISMEGDTVILTTFRGVNRPGPNRKRNDAP